MPTAPLLAFLAAAQVATSDVDPNLAANVSAFTPAVGLLSLSTSVVGPPVAYVTAPIGLGLLAIGPGAGHFVAGDPWRGVAVSAGGMAIPAVTVGLIQLGQVVFPPVTCTAGHNCDSASPLLPVTMMAVGFIAELCYYTWAVGDARATAIRKNEERRSLQGAASGKVTTW